MKYINLRLILITVLALSISFSCRKTDVANHTQTIGTNDSLSPSALKDSSLSYTRNLYLWYDQIPSTFNAQAYADPAALMQAIHQYSNEPGFSAPVDRWSFGIKKADWDNMSAGMSSTVNSSGDFGLSVFFRAQGDLRVRLVEPNSPAAAAGIQRSWRITAINGQNNITTSNANYIVNSVYYSNSGAFTFIKPDGSTVNITLNAVHYVEQPVYMSQVYSVNGQNIGYLVFNSFLGDTTQIYNDLQRVFNDFASQGVTKLIVDLRYNGGGYVSVQEKMADYLAPQSANGQMMFKETYNNKNSQYNLTTYFHKLGPLNLSKIYFIVTTSTASASELLINNLKPYMDVTLVGPSTTHGKPVGFFPVPVGSWYVFPVSFRSTNSRGEGNYFNGMPVDLSASDGLDHDWGLGESCLSAVLSGIGNGTLSRQQAPPATAVEIPVITQSNQQLDEPHFKGMLK